ncbi:MAG: hypothetical protein WC479_06425 [Candidatus Izemoplasmatales bacterium]
MTKLTIRLKGGAGSGFHGHKGRSGLKGGSLPRDVSNTKISLRGSEAAQVHSIIGKRNPLSDNYWRKTDKISWSDKDVFTLNNEIKGYLSKYLDDKYSDEFGTETEFYNFVKSLLDRSNIKLSDGDWDELGQYFDAWVPDKFED